MKALPPPRLWIVYRPECVNALVIRRGPSKRTAFFSWNLKSNEVQLGQWLKGKVYPKRSDLSPNGNYIIYFALNGRWFNSGKGSWTAVSKFPYMKALDFWPKGDAWNGGGLFLSRDKYLLNGIYYGGEPRLSGNFKIDKGIPKSMVENFEDLGIYTVKLLRDGWNFHETIEYGEEYSFGGSKVRSRYHLLTKKINDKFTIEKRSILILNGLRVRVFTMKNMLFLA